MTTSGSSRWEAEDRRNRRWGSEDAGAAPNGRGGSWGVDGTILYAFVNSPIDARWRQGRRFDGRNITRFTAEADEPSLADVPRQTPLCLHRARGWTNPQFSTSDWLDSPAATRLVGGAYSNTAFVDGRLLFVSEGALVAQSFDLDAGRLVGDTAEIARPVAYTGGLGFGAFSASLNGSAGQHRRRRGRATSELRWFDCQGKRLGQLGAETSVARTPVTTRGCRPTDGRSPSVLPFDDGRYLAG